jgi:hypothetical protein
VIVPPVPTPATNAPTSPSVSPDLLRGRAPVHLRVGRVGELLRHEPPALLANLLRQLDRLGHPAERGGLAHLGSVGAQQLRALAAHPLRQGQDQLVPPRRADHRQRDPGVAARRLDDHRLAGLDQPVALGRVDHRHADPVLHRAPGVEVLELGANLARQALAEAREGDQRRVADDGRRGSAYAHRSDG